MEIIADGFEGEVLDSSVEVSCGACGKWNSLLIMDVLRGAEPSAEFDKEAKSIFVRSQIARVFCIACGEEIVVKFGHGEVQPMRYRFALFS